MGQEAITKAKLYLLVVKYSELEFRNENDSLHCLSGKYFDYNRIIVAQNQLLT